MRCEVISLSKVYRLSFNLAEKILRSGYKPDFIVAIARGGFVPARFLCDFLGITDMASIKVQHYEAGAIKQHRAWVKYPLSADVKEKNVLVVDDVNDTGETLIATSNHLKTFHPADVKFAVLHEKQTTVMRADFYSAYQKEWKWIIYPWAVMEDVGSFLEKMEPQPLNVKEAARRLKNEYGIEMSLGWLKKIMQLNKHVLAV